LLTDVIEDLDRQTTDDCVRIISVPDTDSLPESTRDWEVMVGSRGLAAQRNFGLTALRTVDVVFFFDDDAVVRPDYVQNALSFLAEHPEIVGLTGRVLLDGARTGEIAPDLAHRALQDSLRQPPSGAWQPTRQLYGCNFAYRQSAAPGLRFDERLPLYSWLEDHDFARRLMRFGGLAKVDDCVIVHRAAASGGRQAHIRLGYSQVANPVHLWRKGSFPAWLGGYELMRPVAKNIALSLLGPQRHWRRKRLRGNLMAAGDVLSGRVTPERITRL
jgi:GT2 family glycosyltransferase